VGRVACGAFGCLIEALREREGVFSLCGRHADAQTPAREYAFFTIWSNFAMSQRSNIANDTTIDRCKTLTC
jgi:hypothetical protein